MKITQAQEAKLDHADYVEESIGDIKILVTRCPRCPIAYAIDERHPYYDAIKSSLDQGDRSVLFCYHKTMN